MPENPLEARFHQLYGRKPESVAMAPGRIEFIGNHTDYNGGLVLGAAIDRHISVGVARRSDGRFRFASVEAGQPVELTREGFAPLEGKSFWVNYPLGTLVELEAAGMPMEKGLDLLIASDLPPGAGLSSSAALELSTAKALLQLSGHALPLIEVVRAARRAENRFVGVPCGILDQGVSGFGRAGHLVLIDCALESFTTLPLPRDTHFWIFNSNEKHHLVESFYAQRFRECEEARRGLETVLGPIPHLARVPAESFATARGKLPPLLEKRAAHVIEENGRVAACRERLEQGAALSEIGSLLIASHRSSSALFENSTPALDLLVSLACEQQGVCGARLTGGGFGGAILAMTDGRFDEEQADAVVRAYRSRCPDAPEPSVFHVRAGDGAKVVS